MDDFTLARIRMDVHGGVVRCVLQDRHELLREVDRLRSIVRAANATADPLTALAMVSR